MNQSDSTGDFVWTFSSDPPFAYASPESGSVAPGQQSEPITVTLPVGSPCPVTMVFANGDQSGSVSGTVTSVDRGSC